MDRHTRTHTHVKVHFASAKLNTLYTEALFKVCMCLCVQARRREEHFAVIRLDHVETGWPG